MPDTNDWFDPDATTFGDRLSGAREASGLSQSDLAKRLGVKTKTLREWEDDLAEPRANKAQMLAGLLNVSLGWLLTGVGEGIPAPVDHGSDVADLREVLTEMRALSVELSRGAERLARLEKRVRQGLEAVA